MKITRFLLAFLLLSFAVVPVYAETDPVLAVVAGTPITVTDFMNEYRNLPQHLKEAAAGQEGRKEMLDTLILREMILLEAQKDGTDKDPLIEQRMRDLRRRVIVEAFLKKRVETAAAVLDDAELREYYFRHKQAFTAAEQVRVSQIQVNDEATAGAIAGRINKGEDFEALARHYSTDASGANGGDLGWLNKGELDPAFEQAAFALAQGQVSGVVHTEAGYHIIKRTATRQNYTAPFDEVKEQVKTALISEKRQELFIKVKSDLRNSFKFTISEAALEKLVVQ